MFKNYIKFAFRHLRQNLSYSLINIVGLGIGIASVLLIFLYIQHEFSFDDYHEKKERIYRISAYSGFNEKSWQGYSPGSPVEEMRTSYSGVEDAVNMTNCSGGPVSVDNKDYANIDMFCTESNLFNIFTFPLVQKMKDDVLGAPYTAVISESTAKRVFGDENPLGKNIEFNWDRGKKDFQVTAVMEDIPVNSHFKYDVFLSYESLKSTRRCLDCGTLMYTLVKQDADTAAIADQVLNHIQEIDGKSYVEDLRLQPLEEIYFSSVHAQRQGDWQYIQILTAIALVILIIGCANYMNLATARYSKRSKEIGVRKVLGAYKAQLAKQFLFETQFLTLAALPLALLFVVFAIPWFNIYADTQLSLGLQNYWFYIIILIALFATGLMAGSYPALYVSAFKPSDVLQGGKRMGLGRSFLRKGLVSFQFVVTIVMIAVTFLILQQLDYVKEKNLGFDSDKIVSISLGDPTLSSQGETIRQSFSKLSSVKSASASLAPGTGYFAGRRFTFWADSTEQEKLTFMQPGIDSNFVETMGLEILAGENISYSNNQNSNTSREGLINETGARALGYTNNDEAIGKTIANRYKIVGVLKDFHMESLHEEIEAALFIPSTSSYSLSVRLAGGSIEQALDDLRSTWDGFSAGAPLNYDFVEDLLYEEYQNEERIAKVIGVFASLSIIIAGLGLLGMAAFTTQQRMKEIGIRKVLGASIKDIILLLYKDFGILILIASILSVPIVYYIATKWLENFAYRTSIEPTIFLLGIIGVVFVTLIATGTRSLSAALMNPVDSIRQE